MVSTRDEANRYRRRLTRNNVASVHGIVVLDEAKAIHDLHFGDVACAMGLEMLLDVFLGDWKDEPRSAQRTEESLVFHAFRPASSSRVHNVGANVADDLDSQRIHAHPKQSPEKIPA